MTSREIKAGMHDNRSIHPLLPGKQPDATVLWCLNSQPEGGSWNRCWEYRYTHQMTEMEGAAFWNGASLALSDGFKEGWQKGHDAVCDMGRLCSAHQPPS